MDFLFWTLRFYIDLIIAFAFKVYFWLIFPWAWLFFFFFFLHQYMSFPDLLRIYFGALRVDFSSVQSLSRAWLFATPWAAARQASLSITNSQSLLSLMSTQSVMPSNHLILCRPFLPPSVLPSIRVFSNELLFKFPFTPSKCWFRFPFTPSDYCPVLTAFFFFFLTAFLHYSYSMKYFSLKL